MIWMMLMILWNEQVANGSGPKDGKTFKLKAELVLGTEDAGDEQIFSETTTLAVDGEGNLFVNDPREWVVKVFSKNGVLVRQIGKKGSGPGEFNEPVAVAIQEKELYVFDTGHKKMIVLDLEGTFQRDVRFPDAIQGVTQPVILKSGQVVFSAFRTNEATWSHSVILYDPELKPIQQIERISLGELDFSQPSSPSFWTKFLKIQFETFFSGMPVLAPLGEDQFFAGLTHQYEGRLFDAAGKARTRVTREYKPTALSDDARLAICETLWQDLAENPFLTPLLTQAVFKRALSEADLPPGKLPITAVSRFGQGFAILTGYDAALRTGQVDIFNEKGQYIAAAPFKGACKSMYGTKDRLYIVGPDETEALTITRYRLE